MNVALVEIENVFAELEAKHGREYAEAIYGVFVNATTLLNVIAASNLSQSDAEAIFEPAFRFAVFHYEGDERRAILEIGRKLAEETRAKVLQKVVEDLLAHRRSPDDTPVH